MYEAHFQTFEERLLQALKETRSTPDKWTRFSEALGIDKDDAQALDALGHELDTQIGWYERLARKNEAPLRYGPGRLDAQGHIVWVNAVRALLPGLPRGWPRCECDAIPPSPRITPACCIVSSG